MARASTAAVRLLTGEREPVRLATTANITTVEVDGLDVIQGLKTIDGVLTEVGDRVLVKNQTDETLNGIYTASAGTWYRAADARSSRTMQKGTTVHVQLGSANAGNVYSFQTDQPNVGADNIVLALYMTDSAGQDILDAATQTGLDRIATAADRVQTGLDKVAAAASAATATAKEILTDADAAATAADRVQTGLDRVATGADKVATAADRVQTGLDKVATAADRVQTGLDAASATASALAASTSVAALAYTFSTTTADADPGAGIFRLNHATVSSATAAYIDNTDADAVGVTAILDSWDDASAAVRGTLLIRSKANPAIRHQFRVTGTVVDGTGYRKLTLTYVGGAGTLTNTMPCWLIFVASGNDGAGTGDVVGPGSATDNGFVRFNTTTGKLVKDSPATIGTADIANDAVTPAKLDNGAAVSVLGRSANSSGDRADIAAAANDTFLQRVSNALTWAGLTIGMVADGLLTYAKLATAAIASASELRTGTASKLVDAATVHSSMAWVTLTAGAAPAIDHAAGVNRMITHNQNATFAAPSNSKPGFPLNIDITPAGFTSSWNSVFKFGVAGAPTISARAVAHFICRDSSTYIFLGTSDPS